MEAEQIQSWLDTAVGVIGEARLQRREADKMIAILRVFVETYVEHAGADGNFGLAMSQVNRETGTSSGSCKRLTAKLQEMRLVKKIKDGNFKKELAPTWQLVGLDKEASQGAPSEMSPEPSGSGSGCLDSDPSYLSGMGFKPAESGLIPSSFLGRKGSFQSDPVNDPVNDPIVPRNDPANDPVHQENDPEDDEDRPRRPWRPVRIKPENDPISRAEVKGGVATPQLDRSHKKVPPPLTDRAKALMEEIKKPLYMCCPKCHPTMQLAERVSGEWRCEKCWEVMTPSFENLLGEEPFTRRGSAD
jgi:hypothetical protein